MATNFSGIGGEKEEVWWLSVLQIRAYILMSDYDDESLWVRIRGKTNKADIAMGVCYGSLNQN